MLSQAFPSSVPSFFLSFCCFLCRTSANTSSISWHVGDKVKSAATILIKITDNKVPRQRDFDKSLISVWAFCMQPLSSKQMTEVKIIVYYSWWCLIITVLSKHSTESLASARILDFVNSTFCTLFNHCKLIASEWGIRFVLKRRWRNSQVFILLATVFSTIKRSLVDWAFPLLLILVSSHEFTSIFSATDISSDLKRSCVLCGDGSRLLALDILVLCLLCCFTARYKAKMPCKTSGHNGKNVIIQRMEAFSFLLITPVVSLSWFCSLLAAAFFICCLFFVNMATCLSATFVFTNKNGEEKMSGLRRYSVLCLNLKERLNNVGEAEAMIKCEGFGSMLLWKMLS